MLFFKRNKDTENVKAPRDDFVGVDPILSAAKGERVLSRNEVMTIPSVISAVELISNTFAMIPFKLYQNVKIDETRRKKVEVKDYRADLINKDPHDTLDGYQLKKVLAQDFLLDKGGYVYIDKHLNTIRALKYVKPSYVSFNVGVDPIFKEYDILVNAGTYKPYEFLKLLRNTKNGAYGSGLTHQINETLQVAYKRIQAEIGLMETGGNKKGFLQAKRRLSKESVQELQRAWNNFFKGQGNAMVLNDGVEFKESSNTSAENQIAEKSKTFSDEIFKLFNLSDKYEVFIKRAIMPIATAFETALDRELLLESEKEDYFFAADFNELLKGDLKTRYEAYQIAIKNGFKTINEIRYLENDNELEGLDVVTLSLAQVLYNTNDGSIYTPNTNQTVFMKGGEKENENTSQE